VKIFFLYISIISSIFSQDQKFPVAILDFEGQDVKSKVLNACFQRFETSLIESGRFTVIEKNDRDEVLEEQKIQSSGICDTDCIVDVGQMLGADYLVMGEIISLSGLYQINIKVISVESGSVVEKVTGEVEGEDRDLLSAMDRASGDIIRRLSTNRPSFSQLIIQEEEQSDKPRYGFINVTSEPTNAIVLIDNKKEGLTPLKNKKLKIGTKNLKIIKSGYVTINKGLRIVENDTIKVEEIMSYKTGGLNISSEPQGSKIYINNQFKGISPLNIPEIIVGKLEVQATFPNYLDMMENIIIEYDKITDLTLKLIPKFGEINVVLNVKNAIINCNGKILKADTSGFTNINNLTPGDYKLIIAKAGYVDELRNLILLPNKIETVEVEMYLDDKINSNSYYLDNESKNYSFLKKPSLWVKKSSGKISGDILAISGVNAAVLEYPLDNAALVGRLSESGTYRIIGDTGDYLELDIPKERFRTIKNENKINDLFAKYFNTIFYVLLLYSLNNIL
jgi:hypothetical protein